MCKVPQIRMKKRMCVSRKGTQLFFSIAHVIVRDARLSRVRLTNQVIRLTNQVIPNPLAYVRSGLIW